MTSEQPMFTTDLVNLYNRNIFKHLCTFISFKVKNVVLCAIYLYLWFKPTTFNKIVCIWIFVKIWHSWYQFFDAGTSDVSRPFSYYSKSSSAILSFEIRKSPFVIVCKFSRVFLFKFLYHMNVSKMLGLIGFVVFTFIGYKKQINTNKPKKSKLYIHT